MSITSDEAKLSYESLEKVLLVNLSLYISVYEIPQKLREEK